MTRVAVFNQKGGVGKTTLTHNLSAALARRNESLLLLDLDPQTHLTSLWGQMPSDPRDSVFGHLSQHRSLADLEQAWPGIGNVVPGHAELMKIDSMLGKGPQAISLLRRGLDELDKRAGSRAVMMDVCPFLGVLSLNAVVASDWILVPVSADYLSVRGAMQTEITLNALEPVFKRAIRRCYVLNRVDRRRRMTGEIEGQLRRELGSLLAETTISESATIAAAPGVGMDVISAAPNSRSAAELRQLLEELTVKGYFPGRP